MNSDKLKDLIEEGWLKVLKPFIESKEFDSIIEHLRIEKQHGKLVLPKDVDCFNAFKYCPYKKLSIVILGQDPYHSLVYNEPEAHGLAFSYRPTATNDFHIPKSLQTVLREVEDDVYKCNFDDMMLVENPDLTRWATQGILLFNTALTVNHKQPGSHTALWKPFTNYVIQYLNENNPGLIWMLWGADARAFKDKLNNNHHILEAGHPSPINTANPFKGCKHFTQANDLLEKMNGHNHKITW